MADEGGAERQGVAAGASSGGVGGRHRSMLDRTLRRDGISVGERMALRRSRVRVYVTMLAGFYLFLGIPAFAFTLLFHAELGVSATGVDHAKDLFLATMPIASGIIAHWFGARSGEKQQEAGPSMASVAGASGLGTAPVAADAAEQR